jgi:hypothetical protein
MNSDLVHPAGARLAQDDAGLSIVREALELRLTVLAFGGDPANTDFVADHFDRFRAHDVSTGKQKSIWNMITTNQRAEHRMRSSGTRISFCIFKTTNGAKSINNETSKHVLYKDPTRL